MLGIDPSYSRYTGSVYDYFRNEVEFDEARLQWLFSGNAAAFLGLHQGELARLRLEAFYRRHGFDATRLAVFPG